MYIESRAVRSAWSNGGAFALSALAGSTGDRVAARGTGLADLEPAATRAADLLDGLTRTAVELLEETEANVKECLRTYAATDGRSAAAFRAVEEPT